MREMVLSHPVLALIMTVNAIAAMVIVVGDLRVGHCDRQLIRRFLMAALLFAPLTILFGAMILGAQIRARTEVQP